jgi:hypothetical protein
MTAPIIAGRWEAHTGALRFVERPQSNDTNTRLPRMKRILQQEFAVIERDKHGVEKRSFEWHDVPVVEE